MRAAEQRALQSEENLAEGQAFLEENGQRDGVMTTESGLQYEMLREGDGVSPSGGEDVQLHYRGSLIDGTEFDSSYEGEPVVFSSAPGRLIPGFTEALLLLSEGGTSGFGSPQILHTGRMVPVASLVQTRRSSLRLNSSRWSSKGRQLTSDFSLPTKLVGREVGGPVKTRPSAILCFGPASAVYVTCFVELAINVIFFHIRSPVGPDLSHQLQLVSSY